MHLPDIDNMELRNRVQRATPTEQAQNTLHKDMCLIEAAIETDRIVVSLDDNARGLFRTCAQRVGELRSVIWVNPAIVEEVSIQWLESGAKPERHRSLGI